MKKFALWLVLGAGIGLGWMVWTRLADSEEPGAHRRRGPAPVAVTDVKTGPIELRRVYSGTLEASASFVVAPKVGGRIKRLLVDLSDPVKKGQEIAFLDDDEFSLAAMQAKADLVVAQSRVAEAESALKITQRELERTRSLQKQGIASAAQLDTILAEHRAKQAATEVARAQTTRAEASLETAKVRQGYTKVTADWSGEDTGRIVGERFTDEGDTVAANAPLLSIVRLHPIKVVIFVTERDYGRLKPKQQVELQTDAYPDTLFSGSVTRIASVFRESSRQARVEMVVENPDLRLKPGMFVRVEIVLDRADQATLVPVDSLVRRENQYGVFLVSADGKTVSWKPVQEGIRHGSLVEILGEGIQGRVVTLGQQLIEDGSSIVIPEPKSQRKP